MLTLVCFPQTGNDLVYRKKMNKNILEIKNLSVEFDTDEGILSAVDNVGFEVCQNEVLGLVGESGCGKSVTAMSILSLIPFPPGKIKSGEVLFKGQNLLNLQSKQLRTIRGREISMIFQEPGSCLSPLHRVGLQMAETLRIHFDISKKDAREQSYDWLKKVGIPEPGRMLDAYPFELSGGMQQRVMIAMALMTGPSLVIADEPTTALDVTISAQIFDIMRQMRGDSTSVLLITHDLGVIWEMCDRVEVMYAGKIVEEADVENLFKNPLHPYTQGLLKSVPVLDGEKRELIPIKGQVPSPLSFGSGCRFYDRCPHAFERCKFEPPELKTYGPGRKSACLLSDKWI